MDPNRMDEAYFEWLVHLVRDSFGRGRSYTKLCRQLHDTEFIYILDMDANRAADGADLRYRFAYEMNAQRRMIFDLDGRPSSVLEMMVALAIRIEEQFMDDPDVGNRTGMWFMQMLSSLGLSSQHNRQYNSAFVDDILTRFMRREHEADGHGSLFTVPGCPKDLRSIEIWYQLMWYLDGF